MSSVYFLLSSNYYTYILCLYIHLHHKNCSEHQDVDFHVLLAEPMAVADVHQDVDFHVLLAEPVAVAGVSE